MSEVAAGRRPPTRGHKLYFLAVGSFALWVGLWGYPVPSEITRAVPFAAVPPLHARFIAAMYLGGMVLMLGSLFARELREVQIAVLMAAIWTGVLLIVSLFHLDAFDYRGPRVWFWFFAYVVYPLAGAWLAWRDGPITAPAGATELPGWVSGYFGVQGVACIALAAALFFLPGWMASYWPWRIPALLAQIYAGPFLSYGVGSVLLMRRRRWSEVRIPVLAMAVFAALVLLASVMHSASFTPGSISATLWFLGFAGATVMLARLAAAACRSRDRA